MAEPASVSVQSPEEAAALPRQTRWVIVHNLGDEVLTTIAQRCPHLERLHVTCLQDPESSPTDHVFEIAATLTKLRELHLVKARSVTGDRLHELERLPVLETLCLAFLQIRDDALEVLPRLPALRVLDLSCTVGFGRRGVAAIAACRSLRHLGIAGCRDLTADALEMLGELAKLETLEVRQLHCPLDTLRLHRAHRLRGLDLQSASFAPVFLEHLPASVVDLHLGNATLDDHGCTILHDRLPRLRALDVRGTRISDRGVAALAAMPGLHMLDLSQCTEVTPASVETLAASPSLRRITLGRLPWLTVPLAERLFGSGIDVRTDSRELPGTAAGIAASLAELRRRHAAAMAARAALDR